MLGRAGWRQGCRGSAPRGRGWQHGHQRQEPSPVFLCPLLPEPCLPGRQSPPGPCNSCPDAQPLCLRMNVAGCGGQGPGQGRPDGPGLALKLLGGEPGPLLVCAVEKCLETGGLHSNVTVFLTCYKPVLQSITCLIQVFFKGLRGQIGLAPSPGVSLPCPQSSF